ncbi:MAG: LLM class F420-dependent oxidoreductase [Planctomycetota bacterium]|jgi:probable F420-dependent oxidoreductase
MKFGLAFASSVGTDPESALEICRRAEELGFESVWGGEHVIRPTNIESPYPYSEDGSMPGEPETPIPDPLIWLAYVASVAPTLRLGTCILILPQRNPVVLAKEVATLDHLSGGRVELGIGVGWLKEEFDVLGVPWARRGARNDEYIAAMRALWAGPHAEFHGDFVDFDPVTCSPRPLQASIPITVGGDTPAAVKRAARLGDGFFPGTGDVEGLRKLIRELAAAAEDHGRDPKDIEVNAMFGAQMAEPAAGVEQFVELGVSRAMLPAFFFAGPGGLDRLGEFAEKAIAPLSRS